MGDALTLAVAFGVAVSLSPFPIIGIVLILAAPGGRVRGLAFLGGAIAGVGAAGALVLAVESQADPTDGGGPATWVSVVKLILAAALVLLAARKWRGRPRRGEAPVLPGWMTAVETLTTRRAAAMGVLLSGVNPKNLVLIVAAVTSIAGSTDDAAARVTALVVFTVIACAGVALPVAAAAIAGDRAAPALSGVREWMLRHHTVITVVIVLLIAANLAADAIVALAG